MYNKQLAASILKKLNELFPTPTSSGSLWSSRVEGFKEIPVSDWLEAIDALMKLGHATAVVQREGPLLIHAMNILITGRGREELMKTGQEHESVAKGDPESKLIFLSHAARDQEIAILLKKIIEQSVPGSDVFVSSDTEDLRPGDEWVEKIRESLRKAKMLLLLASDRGLTRPWVWYETGSAWSRDIRMIPCCLGNARKNKLSAPFSSVQALNIDEVTDFRNLLSEIGRELTFSVQFPNMEAIVSELGALDGAAHDSNENTLSPEEIQLRTDAANVSARIPDGSRDGISIVLTNESEETVAVREVRLFGPGNIPLVSPYVLKNELKKIIEPNKRLQVDWRPQSDPASKLLDLAWPNSRPPSNVQTVMVDMAIEVGFEVLKRYKRCLTNMRVHLYVLNRRIEEW